MQKSNEYMADPQGKLIPDFEEIFTKNVFKNK